MRDCSMSKLKRRRLRRYRQWLLDILEQSQSIGFRYNHHVQQQHKWGLFSRKSHRQYVLPTLTIHFPFRLRKSHRFRAHFRAFRRRIPHILIRLLPFFHTHFDSRRSPPRYYMSFCQKHILGSNHILRDYSRQSGKSSCI